MFTVEQRDALRERVLRLAEEVRRRYARPRALACLPAPVGAVEPGVLRAALAASVLALMREGAEARLPHAHVAAERLTDLR